MERNEEAIEVLRYARDVVLDTSRKWGQGSIEADGRFCAFGAVKEARRLLGLRAYALAPFGLPLRTPERSALDAAAGMPAWSYNDNYCKSLSDVHDLFDKAIKSLEDPA